MNRLGKSIVVLLFVLSIPATSLAQSSLGNPENWCRNGAFPQEDSGFKLAKVQGAKNKKNKKNKKIHFLNDNKDCPKAGDPKCIERSYVIEGDEVLITRKYGNFVCSWYEPKRGYETVGWLPAENLVIVEHKANPSLKEWLGIWRDGDQTLNIKPEGETGFLHVQGKAYWPGLRTNYHTVHEGSVESRSRPQGNEVVLEQDICVVRLRLIGHLLIASDNLECGGANVSFRGVYQKAR